MTSRPLTEGEIRLALSVFGPRGIFSSFGLPIDLSAIRVQTGEVPFLDSVGKMGFTPFGNINVSADSYSWDYSLGDKSTQRWFIHELVDVTKVPSIRAMRKTRSNSSLGGSDMIFAARKMGLKFCVTSK
jgi:hypothetical protein